MSPSAHVKSSDAIDRFRAAVAQFSDESAQALDEIRMEVDRFLEWLEFEQAAFWKDEVRRCEAKVAEAKVDLLRARAATIDPEHTPSCLQEQKVLESAKRRLSQTEDKLKLVRTWIPAIRQAVQDYRTQIAPFANALTYELPRATTQLRQLASRIADYVSVAVPTAASESNAAAVFRPSSPSIDELAEPTTDESV